MNILIVLPILLAIIFAITISLNKDNSDKQIANKSIIFTSIIAIVTFIIMYVFYNESYTIIMFNKMLGISFKIDGLSVIFVTMVSVLWPIATYYAKTYMLHDGGFTKFYTFYTFTYGAVVGLGFSDNMFTLYLFYEAITFFTLPLVMHNNKKRDRTAGYSYIMHMFFAAALIFTGMMIFASNTESINFNYGGIYHIALSNDLMLAYLLMFIGFSIKAGLFPFHKWIIGAGVAPTTVTALLHAVAVVKSGAFAAMRLTYYYFDPSTLVNSWVQYLVIGLVCISILFGSFIAVKSTHIKRRLAYSTVSQLSYILLGIVSMNYFGLKAALLHMLFHACIKIVLFYSAGNILFTNHKEFTKDIYGLGKYMKVTFICFTISAIALIGILPFGSFVSKYALVNACYRVNESIGLLASVTLIISAFLTAIYMFDIVFKAYFPSNDTNIDKTVKKAPKSMQVTLVLITSIMCIMSLCTNIIYSIIDIIIDGGIM